MVTNEFKRKALRIMNGFFIAIILSLITALTAYGKPIMDLSKLYEPSTQRLGISWDRWDIDNDSTLIFYGHINPNSKVITHLREHTGSLNNDYSLSAEHKYNDFGGEVDMSGINPLGVDLLDSDHYLWDILKANIVAGASNIMRTYKLTDKLLDNGFSIKIMVDGHSVGMKSPMIIKTSTRDFREAHNILSYVGGMDFDLEKVLIEKYNILRGARLNKQILPVEFTSGVNLVDIEIVDNHLIYNCEVTDSKKNEFEEPDNILVAHGRIAVLIEETAEKARSIKGFPLLGFKITYNWYKEHSDHTSEDLLSTATYQFPSVDLIHSYPKSSVIRDFSGTDTEYGYTDEDLEQLTPITIIKSPVDLGLSVNWHSCNLNAKEPNEIGDLLGWGDLVKDTTMLPEKHNGYNAPDTIIGNELFDPFYDPNYDLGRLATEEEWVELCTKCIQIKTKYNGVDGYKFIGPSGSAIFIPITPYRDGENFYKSENGMYWIGNRNGCPRSHANAIFINDLYNIIDKIPITRGLPLRGVQ